MPTGVCVNVREFALRVDPADSSASVSEIHIALLIHDNAGAWMSERHNHSQTYLPRNCQNERKDLHQVILTSGEWGIYQRIVKNL